MPRGISSKLAFFSCLLLLMFSCSEPEPAVDRNSVVAGVCDFSRTVPNSVTAFQDNTNAIIYGNASNAAVLVESGVWSSIYATAQSFDERIDRQVGSQCYPVFACNYFGQCGYVPQCVPAEYSQSTLTDISHLYGIGRALSQEQAEILALSNCEAAVEAFEEESDDYLGYSSGECIKRVTQYCN